MALSNCASQFSAAIETSSVLSSIGVFSFGRLRGVSLWKNLYRLGSRRKGGIRIPLCRQREDVTLLRRHAAAQRVEINLLHRILAPAFDHVEPSIQPRGKTGPRRAEPLLDAAGTPFPGAFANLVGREEPARPGARQFGLVRRRAAVGEPDAPGIFHSIAEMPVQGGTQRAVAGHVDERNR